MALKLILRRAAVCVCVHACMRKSAFSYIICLSEFTYLIEDNSNQIDSGPETERASCSNWIRFLTRCKRSQENMANHQDAIMSITTFS